MTPCKHRDDACGRGRKQMVRAVQIVDQSGYEIPAQAAMIALMSRVGESERGQQDDASAEGERKFMGEGFHAGMIFGMSKTRATWQSNLRELAHWV